MLTQSSFYYTESNTDAAVIQLISESDYEKTISQMSSREKKWLAHQNVSGKNGDTCMIYDDHGRLIKAVMIDKVENRHISLAKLVSKLPEGQYQLEQPISAEDLLCWGSAQYRFKKYVDKQDSIKQIKVTSEQLSWLMDELESLFLVRDLINMPANDMGPSQLAAEVKKLSEQFNAEYEEIIGTDLLKKNYPAIYAVGKASGDAPRLSCLHWGDVDAPHIAIVGKGVCFDSGGLDIKPAPYMRLMKKDMGGAANAIGLACWLMRKKLPIRISLYIAAVENAIGGDAFRPGDVITMRNGLTVEVDNTDAEGRLVIADAMTRAIEGNPRLVIDLATLTGAARAAVGTDISAMFCNNESLAKEIEEISVSVNDPICRLPLFAGYEKMLESSIADMINAPPSPYAGAITAALFLQRFTEPSIPWVHFDIMAWNISTKPGKPEGGEAMAIRALSHYLNKQFGR